MSIECGENNRQRTADKSDAFSNFRLPDPRRLLSGLLGDLALLLDEDGTLALAAAQVVEAGAAHAAVLGDLDLRDFRGMQREDALDTFAIRNLAQCEG